MEELPRPSGTLFDIAPAARPIIIPLLNTMIWPPWSTGRAKEIQEKEKENLSLIPTDLNRYTDPNTIIPTVILTTTILFSIGFYRKYLRRIPDAANVRPAFFRKRSLFGTVTRVGDGDNFHLFHTPGGRLAGWGWAPGRKIPDKKLDLKGRTVSSCFLFHLPFANVSIADSGENCRY